MRPREFNPGFRFSKFDAFVLFFGLWISLDTGAVTYLWIGLAMAFVILQYFVFCNVVRMGRKLELVWAVVFVDLALASHFFGIPSWPVTFAIAFLLAVAFIILEMRKPSYHGVLWERINPGLPEWWAGQRGLEASVAKITDGELK